MSLAGAVALLQAALTLLMLVQAHPELGQSARDSALQVSQQAITVATAALAASVTATSVPANTSPPSSSPPVSSLINTTPIVPPTTTPVTVPPPTNTTMPPVPTPSTSASCTSGGQSYPEGGTLAGNACDINCTKNGCHANVCAPMTYVCKSGAWISPYANPELNNRKCYFQRLGGSYWMLGMFACDYWI